MPAEKPATNQDVENLGKSISNGLSGISKILNKNKEQEKSNTESVLDSLKGINALLSGKKAEEVENKREKGRADQRFLEALKNLGGVFKNQFSGIKEKGKGFFSALQIPSLWGVSAFLGFFSGLGKILLLAPFRAITGLGGLLFASFTSLFLILGAIGGLVYWSTTTPAKRKEHWESFKKVFENIGEWLTTVHKAFTGTWLEELKRDPTKDPTSLPGKWKEFKKTWTAVGDNIAKAFDGFVIGKINWGGSLGPQGPYTGAEGLGKFFAHATIKLGGILLDYGTAIGKFILDPAKYLGILKARISSAFDQFGQNINIAFTELFSLDSLLKFLPDWLIPDSLRKKAIQQREARADLERQARTAESEAALKEQKRLEAIHAARYHELNWTQQRDLIWRIEEAKGTIKFNEKRMEELTVLNKKKAATAENAAQIEQNLTTESMVGAFFRQENILKKYGLEGTGLFVQQAVVDAMKSYEQGMSSRLKPQVHKMFAESGRPGVGQDPEKSPWIVKKEREKFFNQMSGDLKTFIEKRTKEQPLISNLPQQVQDQILLLGALKAIPGGSGIADYLLRAMKIKQEQHGGLIDFAKDKPPRIGDVGLYGLHDKEFVISAQDKLNFAKNLYAGGFGTGAGGGNITIVNAPSQPITTLAQNSTNINQINVPESSFNNERTFRTVAHGQMARA